MNWGLNVWGNVAFFSEMMHFLEGTYSIIFQIVKTSSLQRMPWLPEEITTYIRETEFEVVLESVSRRLHAFYAILYVLRVCFKIVLRSFQTEIAVLQRESTKSSRTLFINRISHSWKIRLGFIDVGWLLRCKKMLNPYPKCTLLLCFVSIIAALLKKCQTLQRARWNTKLLSEHLILSHFGEKKAGTTFSLHRLQFGRPERRPPTWWVAM